MGNWYGSLLGGGGGRQVTGLEQGGSELTQW
jgi:hypothetical protein